MRAALQGVQGTLQLIAERIQVILLSGCLHKFINSLQMGTCLTLKDIQQTVIVFVSRHVGRSVHGRWRGGQNAQRSNRITGSQSEGVIHERLCFDRSRASVAEISDQSRQQTNNMIHQSHQLRADVNGIVQHPVEHILNRPGQLTNHCGFYHPATAFQGMKCATHRGQCFFIVLLLFELRPEFIEGAGYFFRFLEENFDNFIIDEVIILLSRCLHYRNRDGLCRHGLRQQNVIF